MIGKRFGLWGTLLLLFGLLVAWMPGGVMALPSNDISKTVHNLGMTGKGPFRSSDESEICVFCHTPHSASPAKMLWNHYSTAATTFLLYSSETVDAEINSIASNLPTDSASRMCLTCHDGTTALNTLVNPGSTSGNPTMIMGGGNSFSENFPYNTFGVGYKAWIGTNLRNMHPIGFNFDNIGDANIQPKSFATGRGLKFFGQGKDKMECPTCHDPHIYYGYEGQNQQVDEDLEQQYYPFLRVANTSSRLCLTCHIK